MIIRTHIALVILILLGFIPNVTHQFLFIGVAIVATMLPDIDTAFSKLGQYKIFRFLQFFVKHRGLMHSFSFAVVLAIILSFLYPPLALPFFLGYSIHLFADSFTKEGIEPFWPWRKKARGVLRTGSYPETVLFVSLVLADILVLIFVYFI